MIWRSTERKGKVFRVGDSRAVRIPDEFILAGEEIIIRQEKDGITTIYPATVEGAPSTGYIQSLRRGNG